jgi:serine/threonine protein kinase
VGTTIEKLGRYEVLCGLGRGGMGEVSLARMRGIAGFEKLVVLKRIRPDHADREAFIELFLREARLAAALDHPNVVAVNDVGVVQGRYFFAMEYVHGADLRELLAAAEDRRRPLALDEILAIATAVCAGLEHAHTRLGSDGRPLEIIHRDVSTSNVMVGYAGAVKVADFGVAHASEQYAMSQRVRVRGKPSYMSPEQWRGGALDVRSDLYSVGAMLFELATFRPPFRGSVDTAVRVALTEGPPPPITSVRPDLPAELDDLVRRALDVDPARRPASAQDLQLELEAIGRAHRLAFSSLSIKSLMAELFSDQVLAWRQAEAAGRLDQHIVQTVTVSGVRALESLESEVPALESAVTQDHQLVAAPAGGRPGRRRALVGVLAAAVGAIAIGAIVARGGGDLEAAPAPAAIAPAAAIVPAPAAIAPAPVVAPPPAAAIAPSPAPAVEIADAPPTPAPPAVAARPASPPDDPPSARRRPRPASPAITRTPPREKPARARPVAAEPARATPPSPAWDPDALLPPS